MARLTLSEMTRITTTSQWQDIPRDVLIEIFLECLPPSPLQHRQPDVTLAPMLLCQVCTHWRQVALSVPQLWACLSHTATVIRTGAGDREYTADVLRTGIGAKDIQFLRWWTNNLGLKSPILRLRLNWSQDEDEGGAEAEDQGPFFRTLLSSAKYLDLDPTYITALHSWTESSPWIYSNLDTLVLRSSTSQDTRTARNLTIPMDRTRTRPIRRLHLERFTFPTPSSLDAFPWAHLTHASLLSLSIPLAIWFHLIRSLTSLLSGCFHLTSIDTIDAPSTFSTPFHPPPPATLPLLHTLHLSLPAKRAQGRETPKILLALALPNVRRLRITAPALSLAALHAILASTPAVTQLHLCGRVPFAWTPHTTSVPLTHQLPHPQTDGATTPLCHLTPNLTHLLLDGSSMNNHMLPMWARLILSSGWLSLRLRHPDLTTNPNPNDPRPTHFPTPNNIAHVQIAVHPLSASTDAHHTGLSIYHVTAPSANNGWVGSSPGFSRERSSYVLRKLQGMVESCGFAEEVEVVVRGPRERMLWPGNRLEEGEDPAFEDPGFEDEDWVEEEDEDEAGAWVVV